MRVAMPMTVSVKSKRCTAEAAIGRRATLDQPPVRSARSVRNASGTAVDPRHKAHRDRTGGRGAHHGQDDTARAFHEASHGVRGRRPIISHAEAVKQAKAGSLTASCGIIAARQPPPEKCAVNARANEPKPPRVTPSEPEPEDVANDEPPAEESPPKKLLRDHDPPVELRTPLDVDPRGRHSALAGSSDGPAIPGRFGSQS